MAAHHGRPRGRDADAGAVDPRTIRDPNRDTGALDPVPDEVMRRLHQLNADPVAELIAFKEDRQTREVVGTAYPPRRLLSNLAGGARVFVAREVDRGCAGVVSSGSGVARRGCAVWPSARG